MENYSRVSRRHSPDNQNKPNKKKPRKGLKIFFTSLLIIILAILAVFGKLYFDTQSAFDKVQTQTLSKTTPVDFSNSPTFTTLFIGTNKIQGKKVVSEVVVASTSAKNKKTTVVNFPTIALFPDNTNLNMNYANGGESAIINSTQQLLGIKINKIVLADLDGLSTLVQTIKGVSLENPIGFVSNGYHFNQGSIQLKTSEEASAYLSMVNDKDIEGYTTRQQAVTISVFNLLKKPQTIAFNYNGLLDVFSRYVKTNISFSDFKTIILKYNRALYLSKINIRTTQVQGVGDTVTQEQINTVKAQFAKSLN